ncbi:MAG: cellulase family glycosylhydrolase, partial [Pirellulaceae bacterium]
MIGTLCLGWLFSPRVDTLAQNSASGEHGQPRASSAGQAWIRVSNDKRSFVRADTGQAFVPWGFNYDHDVVGRLIEDYWENEWASVEGDFQEMHDLGATVVRIHIQFGKFMTGPNAPNKQALAQLERLVGLAERLGIYVDLTGLGCYHKQDVPAWYDQLDAAGRWDAQARFWEAVSAACAGSPALFCYDIMNEPVVPGGEQPQENWLGPPFAGKHFVQFITRDRGGRPRPQIARQWIDTMVAAIRKHDARHLITVGFVDWSLDRPGLTSGFVPQQVAEPLDFVAVHVYPEKDQVPQALETIRGFHTGVGKPVVIEETFPLKCSFAEMTRFLTESRGSAAGWISFYWGRTADEYRRSASP